MNGMERWMKVTLAVLVLIGVGLFSARFREEGQGVQYVPTTRGETLFRLHCAGCHGEEGRGDGPVAEYLKVAPTDLTALSKRPQGVDAAWLATVIDGE